MPDDVSGDWINGLGSTMTLKIKGNKHVSGTYSTAVGGDDVRGKKMELNGLLHYPLITFFVDYTIVKSLATWVGRFAEGINPKTGKKEPVLHTIWILADLYKGTKDAPEQTDLWETFHINQNNFWRPAPKP